MIYNEEGFFECTPGYVLVTLYTANLEEVIKIEIIRFITPPDVVIWGDRVFTKVNDKAYREAFCYVVPMKNIQLRD